MVIILLKQIGMWIFSTLYKTYKLFIVYIGIKQPKIICFNEYEKMSSYRIKSFECSQ